MQLRRAVIADMEQLKALYFNTILAVNSKDYSKIQSQCIGVNRRQN